MTDIAAQMRELFSTRARLQRYLDVEAALALTEGELGVIPAGAARKIAATARVELLNEERIAGAQLATGHLMVPIVAELAGAVGDPDGGWVHWGATTQNIQQTGDVLGMRDAVGLIGGQLCYLLEALSDLGERGAAMLMAGRTHWQQAVPITFGFKVAGWSDVMMRHLERLEQLTPRLLISMTGGATGNFASFGPVGPEIQAGVAKRLGLTPMDVPMRNIVDPFAEFVLVLSMIAATSGSIAEEISRLMSTEIGEVAERLSDEDVGSSTMPQKRNAKQCGQVVIKSAELRSLAPLALDAMIQSHEVDGTRSAIMDHAVEKGCVLACEILVSLTSVAANLELFPARMRQNLNITNGLISAEAIMLALGKIIGRQAAHDVVHELAGAVATGKAHLGFAQLLAADPRVRGHLDLAAIEGMTDPAGHTGLSEQIAREAAARGRAAASRYRASLRPGAC